MHFQRIIPIKWLNNINGFRAISNSYLALDASHYALCAGERVCGKLGACFAHQCCKFIYVCLSPCGFGHEKNVFGKI